MKIYDCFTFYNELDLLDLRLSILGDVVDHIVIVEATSTFQNQPKPLFLKENWSRYEKYHDKIIHVVVDLDNADPWQNERHQRDSIMQGLVDASPHDVAIIGDVDEFIRPETINTIRNSNALVYGLRVPYFNFKFNYMLVNNPETYCVWATAAQVSAITSPEELRHSRWSLNQFPFNYNDGTVHLLEHAGWHFTYLGDDEFIRTKLKSFAHSELNTDEVLNQINVEQCISMGRGFNINDPREFVTVAMDDYFHPALQSYSSYIISSGTVSATEFLPKSPGMLELSKTLPTDKEHAHKYVSNFYVDEFSKYKLQNITMLEIGIWNGGSVKMWHEYFPNGTIIGTDITDSRIIPGMTDLPRANINICDAYNTAFRDSLPDLDIVIDDGPHTEESQLQCLSLYLPKLKSGGVLVIEDILSDTSIDKFKALVPAEGFTYEVKDIRPISKLPESLLFIVRRK